MITVQLQQNTVCLFKTAIPKQPNSLVQPVLLQTSYKLMFWQLHSFQVWLVICIFWDRSMYFKKYTYTGSNCFYNRTTAVRRQCETFTGQWFQTAIWVPCWMASPSHGIVPFYWLFQLRSLGTPTAPYTSDYSVEEKKDLIITLRLCIQKYVEW